MSGKFALILANTDYNDPRLARLTAPGKDAEGFARVLKAPDLAAFDEVLTLLNQTSYEARRAVARFFSNRAPGDLLLLYFSGHGLRDDQGRLYLATTDTDSSILDATAIPADSVTRAMDGCRSKRQVLILDCCNSGAFAYGAKAAAGASMGTGTAFEGTGYGRVVLTASDATQFAYEGDRVIGETQDSLFTHFLVKGLEGEADLDGDGRITVDELYDYAYDEIVQLTPKQTPSKWAYKEQGEMILRQGVPVSAMHDTPLPPALLDSTENPFTEVRLGAVQQLARLLNGRHAGLSRSARAALEKMSSVDDSQRVREAARQVLERGEQAAEPPQKEQPASQPLLATKSTSRPPWLARGTIPVGILILTVLVSLGLFLFMMRGNSVLYPHATPTATPTQPPVTATSPAPATSTPTIAPTPAARLLWPQVGKPLVNSHGSLLAYFDDSGLRLGPRGGAARTLPWRQGGLACDFPPSISPDGSMVAIESEDPIKIHILDSANLQQVRYRFTPSVYAYGLSWSPDGASIVFGSTGGLFVARPDGTAEQRITSTDEYALYPHWSPDGKEIAYTTERSLRVIDQVGKMRDVVENVPGTLMAPRWSPDGKKIAYVFYHWAANGVDYDTAQLYVVDAAGKKPPVPVGDPVTYLSQDAPGWLYPIIWIDNLTLWGTYDANYWYDLAVDGETITPSRVRVSGWCPDYLPAP